MRLLTFIILSINFAYFAHARVVQHPALGLRSAMAGSGMGGPCNVGQPGGVYIQITKPDTATSNSAAFAYYPPAAATKCMPLDTILKAVPSNGTARVTAIGPDGGGHCLVYHSDDCKDNTGMPLNAPSGVVLKYPK